MYTCIYADRMDKGAKPFTDKDLQAFLAARGVEAGADVKVTASNYLADQVAAAARDTVHRVADKEEARLHQLLLQTAEKALRTNPFKNAAG